MNTRWRVELHSHTVWSKDCLVEFDTILRLCETRDIDQIAITDHNTAAGALALQKIAPQKVIVGEEIMTTQGELLAYFVRETVPAGLTPQETLRRLHEQGAVVSVSHPFDRLRSGAWREEHLLRIIEQVDAIETFNARCVYRADNARALSFAEKHGLCGTAGSDAHTAREYGQAVTCLRPFADAETFREALREATFEPRYSPHYVHFGSTVAKWVKRLGLKRRLWEGG